MASIKKIVQMMERVKDGPACKSDDWDYKILPSAVREMMKKYDLKGTYNPETPVNQDMELADRYFAAGLELAEKIGLHCTDTETQILFSREELLQGLKEAPDELVLGTGTDQVILRSRGVEDKRPPLYCASLSIQVDEELYLPLTEGLVGSKSIDMLQGPSLDTVFGIPAYADSPFESAVGLREAKLRKEALWRAGRPGIPQQCMSSSTTHYAFMSGYPMVHTPENPAIGVAIQPAELKTNYSNFHKVIMVAGYGGFLRAGVTSMIGGYSGPPEGTAIANIASDILQFALLGADISCCSVYDVRLNSNCCRTGLWTQSISLQANSRNTHTIHDKIINQSAGPCTEDILYTNMSGLVTTCVSGMELTTGPRSAGGAMRNHLTPLEGYVAADMFKAAAKLSLSEANELVLYGLSKYEASVDNQPMGKSFYDCYDINTLKPSAEWQGIADKVREDLSKRGLAL